MVELHLELLSLKARRVSVRAVGPGGEEFRDEISVFSARSRAAFLDAMRRRFGLTAEDTFHLEKRLLHKALLLFGQGKLRLVPVPHQPLYRKWLWPGRLAMQTLNLLFGNPGLGKTMVAIDIAARVTRGDPMPFEEKKASGGPQSVESAAKAQTPDQQTPVRAPAGVLFLSSEDSLEQTIVPRLVAAGGRTEYVYTLATDDVHETGALNLASETAEIAALIDAAEPAVKLIVIDPIVSFLGCIDGNNNSAVRAALAPLSRLAMERDLCVLMVTHQTKARQEGSVLSAIGSIGFIAAARAAFSVTVTASPHDRRLIETKNNISAPNPPLRFRIDTAKDETVQEQPVIRWLLEEEVQPVADATTHTVADCKAVIHDMLLSGERPAWDVLAAASAAGFSERTARAAKAELGVQSRRVGFGQNGAWLWSLPAAKDDDAEPEAPENQAA
jgi:hypothetical protein